MFLPKLSKLKRRVVVPFRAIGKRFCTSGRRTWAGAGVSEEELKANREFFKRYRTPEEVFRNRVRWVSLIFFSSAYFGYLRWAELKRFTTPNYFMFACVLLGACIFYQEMRHRTMKIFSQAPKSRMYEFDSWNVNLDKELNAGVGETCKLNWDKKKYFAAFFGLSFGGWMTGRTYAIQTLGEKVRTRVQLEANLDKIYQKQWEHDLDFLEKMQVEKKMRRPLDDERFDNYGVSKEELAYKLKDIHDREKPEQQERVPHHLELYKPPKN